MWTCNHMEFIIDEEFSAIIVFRDREAFLKRCPGAEHNPRGQKWIDYVIKSEKETGNLREIIFFRTGCSSTPGRMKDYYGYYSCALPCSKKIQEIEDREKTAPYRFWNDKGELVVFSDVNNNCLYGDFPKGEDPYILYGHSQLHAKKYRVFNPKDVKNKRSFLEYEKELEFQKEKARFGELFPSSAELCLYADCPESKTCLKFLIPNFEVEISTRHTFRHLFDVIFQEKNLETLRGKEGQEFLDAFLRLNETEALFKTIELTRTKRGRERLKADKPLLLYQKKSGDRPGKVLEAQHIIKKIPQPHYLIDDDYLVRTRVFDDEGVLREERYSLQYSCSLADGPDGGAGFFKWDENGVLIKIADKVKIYTETKYTFWEQEPYQSWYSEYSRKYERPEDIALYCAKHFAKAKGRLTLSQNFNDKAQLHDPSDGRAALLVLEDGKRVVYARRCVDGVPTREYRTPEDLALYKDEMKKKRMKTGKRKSGPKA